MSRRRWTIIVLGAPGVSARRFVVGAGVLAAATLVVLAAAGGGLFAGWALRGEAPKTTMETRTAPEAPEEPPAAPSTPAPEELRAEVVPVEDEHLLLEVPDVGDVPPDPPVLPTVRRTGPRLRLYSLHLGERVEVVPFRADGGANGNAFEAIAHIMRCRHTDHIEPIHQELIRLLMNIAETTEGRTIHLVSGYRTPNVRGTSQTSYHTRGMAADIRIAGVGVSRLRRLAIDMGARGIGVYRRGHFVHVDVRDQEYRWEG